LVEPQALGLLGRILDKLEELISHIRRGEARVYVSPYTGLRNIVLNVSPRNIPVLSKALHDAFKPRYPSRNIVDISPGKQHVVVKAGPGWLYMAFVHIDDGGTGLGAFLAFEVYVKKYDTYERWPILCGSIAWKELYGMEATSPFKVDRDYIPGVRGLWNLLFRDPDGQEIPWEWKLVLRYPRREEIEKIKTMAKQLDKLGLVELADNALNNYGRHVVVDYAIAYVEVDRDKLLKILETGW